MRKMSDQIQGVGVFTFFFKYDIIVDEVEVKLKFDLLTPRISPHFVLSKS